ncbi:MAG: serine/threonine protein kinase [Planctomycetota bacterium]|jgi:serine/threonine-protein kinase
MKPERLGPYQIEGILGRGGMGAVYQAKNEESGEPAAVKVLSASLSRHEDFRQRFESEIETLRKLRHPNIVRLYGFGEQEGVLYYGMELVDGTSLEHQLRSGKRFTWREVAEIGVDTCKALRHAHDRGVIHRDIKPANLLLTGAGQVKLSDFGIARLFGTTGLTAAGNVLGTVEFMAPEQADSRPAGPRTDLYSLGAVFFALLTGRPPFQAATPLQMLERQRFAKPEPVGRYAPGVPTELELIIDQLLEKDPQKRIANAALLMRRLEAMMHGLAAAETDSHRPPQEDPESGQTANGRPTPDAPEESSPPEAADEPPAGDPNVAEEIAETKATSAFRGYARGGSDSGSAVPVAEAPDSAELDTVQAGTDHFTAVGQEDLDRIESEEPDRPALISPQTWVLALSLLIVGVTAWYLLRPLSAEALFERINEAAIDGKTSSLLNVEHDVQKFLSQFPDHPRAEEAKGYAKEIERYRLDRRFERLADERDHPETLLPIERAYVEAIRHERLHPDLGIEKLEAVLTLFGDSADDSGPVGQCFKLASRRLDQLRRRREAFTPGHLAELHAQLDRADRLSQSDSPEDRAEADNVRRALIELFDHTIWAREAVRRARNALPADGRHE